MIEIALFVIFLIFFFGYVGYFRGMVKEIISTSGIILALFTLHQFDNVIRGELLISLTPASVFYVQTIFFLVIVFFAYHNRAVETVGRGDSRRGRDSLQTGVLGALIGGVNGYLIGGTIWYLLDINRNAENGYAISPYITEPLAGTLSADMATNLPLYVLAGGPGTTGELLSLAVIILFLIVLILI